MYNMRVRKHTANHTSRESHHKRKRTCTSTSTSSSSTSVDIDPDADAGTANTVSTTFVTVNHSDPPSSVWNELRNRRQLCDGIVRSSDGAEFPVHRAILAATSPFFRALFTNSINGGRPEVTAAQLDVPTRILTHILDFAYTGCAPISNRNVQSLLTHADRLEIVELVHACCTHMKNHLHVSNCVQVWRFARHYFLWDLAAYSVEFIRSNFVELSDDIGFRQLTAKELSEIIGDDELNVRNERDVVRALKIWLGTDEDARAPYLPSLLGFVRLGLLENGVATAVRAWPECKRALEQPIARRPRVPHQLLVAFGGWSDGSPVGYVEALDVQSGRWMAFPGAHLRPPRAYHGLCSLDGLVYIIGGFDGHEHYSTVRCWEHGQWTERACMHYPRCYVSVTTSHGLIYAFGGYNGRIRMRSAEKYEPSRNQWRLIAPMQIPRSDAGSASLGPHIYVVGGFDGQHVLRSAEVYDTTTDQWSIIPHMTEARSGVSLISYGGSLYVLGGFNGNKRLTTCEKMTPDIGASWQPLPEFTTPRSNFAAVVMNGAFYVLGGFDGKGTVADCERMEVDNGGPEQWMEIPPMRVHKSALSACVLKGLHNTRPIYDEHYCR